MIALGVAVFGGLGAGARFMLDGFLTERVHGPVPLATLDGLDSLLSIVQMPGGVPVATVSIGGAKNAALLAVKILATADETLLNRLESYASTLALEVEEKNVRLKASLR